MSQSSIEALLAERIGLDSASLGPMLLKRALERRFEAVSCTSQEEYLRKLKGSSEEFQELVEALVVPESWFFRDAQPFELLREHAASWRPTAEQPEYRVLSVPCANGEEPYTIAMVLQSPGLPAHHIDAVDLSVKSLKQARLGVFSLRALHALPPGYKERYFRPRGQVYELEAALRQSVHFAQANIVEPNFLAGKRPYHAIFCRNLLIYLTRPAREQALSALQRLLLPDGLLFVGHAESGAVGSTAVLQRHPRRAAFAFVKPATPRPAVPRMLGPAPAEPKTVREMGPSGAASGTGSGPGPGTPAESAAATGVRKRATEPVPPPLTREVSRAPAPVPARTPAGVPGLLSLAWERANSGRLEEAVRLCEEAVQRGGPSADAYHLLGTIQQTMGNLEQAQSTLNKAVYLDPNHVDSLLALALIAQRRGDQAAAERYRRQVERARDSGSSS